MAICKYCGNETGGSQFCQNCGAKVDVQPMPEAQPVMQSPVMENPYASSQNQIPVQPQAYTQQAPMFYTPGGAGGLIAGHIIAIILGILCCCFTYFISLGTMVLGIIGVVFAAKVRSSTSEAEEAHNRKVSRILLLIAFAVLLVGVALFIVDLINTMHQMGNMNIGEMWESIYASVSESMKSVSGFLHI